MAHSADVTHRILSFLSSSGSGFLLRSNGDRVKIESLKGKKLGVYFSASWCGPCREFTPTLVEVYNEIAPKGDFEVLFVPADKDDESFKSYFSKMPWLAIPFSDSETRSRLDKLFHVKGIPHLALIDETGTVLPKDGVDVIHEYGADGYPFTLARLQELKHQLEEARRNQSLRSILVSPTRDYVISSANKIPVSELEGKTVGLYFCFSSHGSDSDFTPQLMEVYEKLKAKGENFEIVCIPVCVDEDEDEESFNKGLNSVPWLSVPFKDKFCGKLARYFDLSALPTLLIIGPDGKTLQSNAFEAIKDHGIAAYPFTPEKFAELDKILKAREAAQTLESILVLGDLDFVIGKDGVKVPVSELKGKIILLYFSDYWCPLSHAFLPKLIDAYHKIKAKDNAFEVIFVSGDMDQPSFDELFAGMPWLALPFGDKRNLRRKFKVYGIPMLVAIGSNGQTITREARHLVSLYGADAYPFTEERIRQIESTRGWPEKVTHETHEHELVLTRRAGYWCDSCDEEGDIWSYSCYECDFDLHPKCALEVQGNKDDAKEEENPKEGWVCDGEVCTKA